MPVQQPLLPPMLEQAVPVALHDPPVPPLSPPQSTSVDVTRTNANHFHFAISAPLRFLLALRDACWPMYCLGSRCSLAVDRGPVFTSATTYLTPSLRPPNRSLLSRPAPTTDRDYRGIGRACKNLGPGVKGGRWTNRGAERWRGTMLAMGFESEPSLPSDRGRGRGAAVAVGRRVWVAVAHRVSWASTGLQ